MPAHSINTKNRRSIRLPKYDYRECGFYFVTVCAWEREHLFGSVVDGQMQLNEIGRVVEEEWSMTPNHYENVSLDEYVIMPNHMHGILVINDRLVGAQFIAPNKRVNVPIVGVMNHAPTLGMIVRYFKARSCRLIHKIRPHIPVWQRNYYERIIRNEKELLAIRQYIRDNPFNWDHDPDNLP